MSYVVVARCVAQDEHKDEIEAVLREFVPQCRRQPGHHDFVAHKSVQRPNEFLLYEHYGTEQDFVDHQATAHFKEPPCRRYCWGAQLRARAGGRAHQRAATPLALYTDRTASPFDESPDLREPEAGVPLPAAFVVKYGVKACERTSSIMPSPSSATTISTNPRAASADGSTVRAANGVGLRTVTVDRRLKWQGHLFQQPTFIDDIRIGNCCFMRSKVRGKAVQRRACFPGMATPACLEPYWLRCASSAMTTMFRLLDSTG
jgi:quinol monooxygenase YgiN